MQQCVLKEHFKEESMLTNLLGEKFSYVGRVDIYMGENGHLKFTKYAPGFDSSLLEDEDEDEEDE
jgi:hypothetical protein